MDRQSDGTAPDTRSEAASESRNSGGGLGGKLLLALSVTVVLLGVVDQVLQHVVLSEGTFAGRPLAPFDPPLFHQPQWDELERVRGLVDGTIPDDRGIGFDRDLGWIGRAGRGNPPYTYDWAGARQDGSDTTRDVDGSDLSRVLAIGCSFTHGDGVEGAEAWPAVVERSLSGHEVVNLGVGAYGLDQALLRLRRDGPELAPDKVWMGFFPAACLRVTTHFRPLARHWSTALAFKPRFSLAPGGELELHANPVQSLADIPRLLSDQQLFLERLGPGDHWLSRAPWAYAPRGSNLLHHSGLGRLALTFHENLGREHAEHLVPEEAPTRRLLEAIVLATAAEAEALGAQFELLVLPGPTDLAWVDAHGAGYWQGLCDDLARAGVRVHDMTETLRTARDDGASLFLADGHYNAEGNRLVGESFAASRP
ncbi:MAG: SGNH/GDSL hydrolase family protein [Planctomycetota bacterium]|jgi:hypothetical protein